MTTVDIDQASLSELVTRLCDRSDPIVIEQAGEAVAVIASYENFKRLEILEDMLDVFRIGQAIVENNDEFVTPADLIDRYNAQHGTEFSIESIIND